ncbi:MAG: endo-1,4-beta-xylanase, partial [Promicromonosporaceae bacterium]|nr:endo-1,4-beta-xylanase [Promicromonosporaceae bacterium]
GLTATGITATPAHAAPIPEHYNGDFTPVVVFHRDFADGQIAGGDGGTFDVVDNPLGDGLVQRITTADSWHGLQIPATVFEAGATYLFEADVLRPAGSDPMNARFEGASNPWPWVVGNHAMSDSAWTTISGEYTWDPIDPMAVRLVNGGAGTFYADSVTVTRIAPAPSDDDGGDDDDPVIGGIVIDVDFTDGAITPLLARGLSITADSFVADPADAANTVLLVSGADTWHGIEVPGSLLYAGGDYELSFRARTAPGQADTNVRFEGSSSPWPWVMGNQPLTSEWTEFTHEFVAPGMNITLTAGAANWLLDDVVVTRIGDAPDPGDGPDRDDWVLVDHLDFADGTFGDWDGDHGATVAVIVPNPHGEGNVLQVTRADDWHGISTPVGLLTSGASYYLEMSVRIAADGPAAADAMFLGSPGWAHIGRTPITNADWTAVSGAWTPVETGSTARIVTTNVGDFPTYNFLVEDVYVWRTSAPTEFEPIEPGTVVLASHFDDDGDAYARNADGEIIGEWVVRQTTPEAGAPNLGDAWFTWIPGAADSAFGLALNNRDNQGDGHLINVADILEGGRPYRFRGYARFLEPGHTGNLTLSSQTDGAFTNLMTGIAITDQWTPISGSFTFPAFDGQANLYFETPWAQGAPGDTTDFAIDQIEIYIPEDLTWERDLPRFFESLNVPAVGVAVDTRELTGVASELVLHHFNHIVGENHMKPEAWFSAPGVENFRRHPQATAMLDFAVEHDLTLFGHVLVWHSQTPAWFFTDTGAPGGRTLDYRVAGDTEIMRDRMAWFIRSIAANISADYGLFGSATNPMNSWEVVNEVVAGNPVVATGMREASPWFQAFGPGPDGFGSMFMVYAFQYADYYFNNVFHVDGNGGADPDFRASGDNRITLWINDYNTERGLDSFIDGDRMINRNTKRYVLLNITNWLLDQGAPVDGVGHQFHAGLQWPVQG